MSGQREGSEGRRDRAGGRRHQCGKSKAREGPLISAHGPQGSPGQVPLLRSPSPICLGRFTCPPHPHLLQEAACQPRDHSRKPPSHHQAGRPSPCSPAPLPPCTDHPALSLPPCAPHLPTWPWALCSQKPLMLPSLLCAQHPAWCQADFPQGLSSGQVIPETQGGRGGGPKPLFGHFYPFISDSTNIQPIYRGDFSLCAFHSWAHFARHSCVGTHAPPRASGKALAIFYS